MRPAILLRPAFLMGISLFISAAPSVYAQDSNTPPPSQSEHIPKYMELCSKKNPPPCVDAAPKATYSPTPPYSEDAKRAEIEGTVILWAVIGTDGRAHDIRVTRVVGHGLDGEAIETLKQWKFKPATSKGTPVPAAISVQMFFHLR
jgi:TonB family protein